MPGALALFTVLCQSKTLTLIAKNPAGSSNLGNLTNGGGLAAAFDGTTIQARASSAAINASNSGYNNYVGKDWGAGSTKVIGRWIAYGTSDEGFLAVIATGVKLQGSNDNSTWTDLDSFTSASGAGGVYDRTIAGSVGAFRYHRVNISGNGSNSAGIAEITWYELL